MTSTNCKTEQAAEFWQFSLSVYGQTGVESACLALQDKFGVNVNLALFALWCESQGWALSISDLDTLWRILAPRDHRLETLRCTRRAAKNKPNYNALKQTELQQEKAFQSALIHAFEPNLNRHPDSPITTLANWYELAPEGRQLLAQMKESLR